jgi:hypothetical protein
MFEIDSVIAQPDGNVYIIIQTDDCTKCEGKLSPSQVITSMLTSSQMITPKVPAYAIIQQDDIINILIWLGDNNAIVILNYMAG